MEHYLTPAEPPAASHPTSKLTPAGARETAGAVPGTCGQMNAIEPQCRIYHQDGAWLAVTQEALSKQTGSRKSYRSFSSLESAVAYADQHRLTYRVHARPLWICTWRKDNRDP